ncbi:MAG: UvrD-helicase domain-containing protein, partial [Pyrinomonadaceae bacterium]|nr:UvrD-helicase domain-containing protein [Pyrinomonadaceae bacterium]
LCTFTEKAAFELRDRLSAAAAKVKYEGDLSELRASTIHSLCNRLLSMRDLLSSEGVIYVHVGHSVSHYVRSVMDDLFGYDRMLNEIIWQRTGAHNDALRFGVVSDVILYYAKGEKWSWNQQFTEYEKDYVDTRYRYVEEETGRKFYPNQITGQGSGPPRRFGDRVIPAPAGRHWAYTQEDLDRLMSENGIYFSSTGYPYIKNYLDEQKGRPVQNVWTDLPMTKSGSERSDYPTQKPERLLQRIVSTSTAVGGLVADFFCGSGTTMAVAEKLGRRWIGCDLGRYAIHTSRKRMLGIDNCKPFEILNLGKYERQYWQGVTFAEKGSTLTENALYEYLAFILKLYAAQPVVGLVNLHGKRGRAMLHIGAVDAPVTIDEVNAALAECVQLKQTELHILGWEWEMGINNLLPPEAKKQGVKLLFLQIPREVMEQQAVDKGDIEFFELAYLEVEIEKPKKLTTTIKLIDFVIPNTELIPEEVRSKVKKWSDYIDYWAIDWDFQNDTFMQGWVNYRTRKDRSLALISDPHTYEKAGRYRVLVKVVDIFGNDTTQAFDVDVK